MAKISIIGTGYVGLVSGLCFSKLGHEVTCIDIDKKKIAILKKGIPTIYEPGINKLMKTNIKNKRINFSTDLKNALKKAEFSFIAVGTPQSAKGKADMKYYWSALNEIIKSLPANKKELIIVNKSTVPVGTAKKAVDFIEKQRKKKKFKTRIFVVSNPEFLREGSAITDFLKPDRIVIGSSNLNAAKKTALLYRKIKAPKIITNAESSELIKYASNAFLATKISFVNEVALFCNKTNADINVVSKGMGLDKRIGPYFLNAGVGYGGSCFPKDVQALIHLGKKHKVDFRIINSAEKVNKEMKLLTVKLLKKELKKLKGKTITVLGLAFKANTDDMREASSIKIINTLLKEKVKIKAFDPIAEKNAKLIFGTKISYAKKPYDALKNSDALVLVTEWPEFKKLDLKKVKKIMKGSLLIDGRNFLDKRKALKAGFKYIGIGN